jgi:hypothetical protein
MWTDELNVSDDPSAAAWIAPRLEGEFGAVTLTVPSGYDAYVRICHPATDDNDAPVTWSEVATATGRTVHHLMQWHALVGSPDPLNFKGSLWRGGDPDRGNLAPDLLESLCALLRNHTRHAAHCFFGLWIGWGWVESGSVHVNYRHGRAGVRYVSTAKPTDGIPPAFSAQELSRARLKLPSRDYLLLAGPLSAATRIGNPAGIGGFAPQSPNLFWPADQAWCVASEIDFDSTLVGGTGDLIQAILDTPTFDAWPVGPHDSLAYDGDQINNVS